MSIESLLQTKSTVIVCGSGGVGKTTTAASIAIQTAVHTNRKVLVITVDPARRLADVLGTKNNKNEVSPVEIEGAKGKLFSQMLDTKTAWDELVWRHAPDPETARKIIGNPLYGEITGRFVQSHDYIAMETLHELHDSGEFDVVVIDTPPATQAVDFLDAPNRMASFFDSRLLKFLIAPARASFMSVTTRAFLKLADSLLGKRFLEDITELFTLLETMRPGFIARANEVDALLRSETTTFVVVTTPEPAPSKSAQRFIGELQLRGLELGAVVLNKVLPAVVSDPDAKKAARALESDIETIAATHDDAIAAKRVLSGIAGNFARFEALSKAEREVHATLAGNEAVRVSAPWFSNEVDDMSALRRLGESIWR